MAAEPAARSQDQAADLPRRAADLIEWLNRGWRVTGPLPPRGSLKRRVAYEVRRALAPLLGPQESFNSAVVQYINATRSALADAMEEIDLLRRERESLAARETRMEAGMTAIRATHDELRQSIGVLQHAVQMLRQEATASGSGLQAAGQKLEPGARSPEPGAWSPRPDALGFKYVGFEDQFRGSREAIRERLAGYVPIFAGAADVLDIGCGRGEFLALLGEHGITARGIDTNDAMVRVSREKGLRADTADALAFLGAQPPGSLGGLFAAQVVEHLEPSYLAALLDAAFAALRPGAPIVLETINPACWFAFFESYIRDITHVRPLHPDTLKYLLLATGFQRLDIRYRVPYPEHEKLQPVPSTAALADSVEMINANVEKLNRLLFTHLDYAAIGYRP